MRDIAPAFTVADILFRSLSPKVELVTFTVVEVTIELKTSNLMLANTPSAFIASFSIV